MKKLFLSHRFIACLLLGCLGLFSTYSYAAKFVNNLFSAPRTYVPYDYIDERYGNMFGITDLEGGAFTVSKNKIIVRDSQNEFRREYTIALKNVCVQTSDGRRFNVELYVITSGDVPSALLVTEGWGSGNDSRQLYTVSLCPYNKSTGCYEWNKVLRYYQISRYK